MESLIIKPSYQEPWEFELYDFRGWDAWCINNWRASVYLSVVYVGLVYWGRKWMEGKRAFELRIPLIAWNLTLSLGSALMFYRLYPELLHELKQFGVKHSICNRDFHTITHSFWLLVFTLSKILEFGDTAFIVLRKQKLVFLHWYHHITVAMYCFYVNGDFDPAGRWFSAINSFIHTVMYGYYALKAMGVHVPKKFAMVITSLQILQMMVGILINILSTVWILGDDDNSCPRPYSNIFWNSVIYSTYFVLFVNFFVHTYGSNSKRRERSNGAIKMRND